MQAAGGHLRYFVAKLYACSPRSASSGCSICRGRFKTMRGCWQATVVFPLCAGNIRSFDLLESLAPVTLSAQRRIRFTSPAYFKPHTGSTLPSPFLHRTTHFFCTDVSWCMKIKHARCFKNLRSCWCFDATWQLWKKDATAFLSQSNFFYRNWDRVIARAMWYV